MEVSEAKQLFCMKGFPFAEIDELFAKVSAELSDGYVMARDGNISRYLFIIAGQLYCGAIVGPGGRKTTNVRDFFLWYKASDKADICVFRADKKLLLCMLVRISQKPAQSFTTDVVNLEDVVKKIESQEKDIVMGLNYEKQWGFAIFMKGKAVYLFLPGASELEGTPLDRLLLFSYNLPEGHHISAEIFTDTTVVPADDSASLPSEGITAAFIDEGGQAAVAVAEAEGTTGPYVEVLEDGKVTGTHPLKVELTVGREATCDVYLPEAGVSRNHAVIKTTEDGKFLIEDVGSANGTFFKGIRITQKELSDGDEIKIRDYTLRFNNPVSQEGKAEPKKAPSEDEDLASQTIYAEPLPEDVAGDVEEAAVPTGAALTHEDGTVYPLASITTIGKDEESDIKLEGMLVAKRHVSIIRGRDVYKLIKKGGLSAVKVNGDKISEKVLRDGDLIEIGGVKMTFKAG